jgi:hypothetical protein
MKANQALCIQQEVIQKAIEILKSQLDNMTSTISPDDATWVDVGKFAQVADAAQCVIERLS